MRLIWDCFQYLNKLFHELFIDEVDSHEKRDEDEAKSHRTKCHPPSKEVKIDVDKRDELRNVEKQVINRSPPDLRIGYEYDESGFVHAKSDQEDDDFVLFP